MTKKLILLIIAIASLSFTAHAVILVVKSKSTSYYDLQDGEIYYEEIPTTQGVTASGVVNNYTYVDLGLFSKTKWATYNVGATKPTEYGNYFAWGETKPKKGYTESTYKWTEDKSYTFTKYVHSEEYGTVDNKTVLEAEDDAATANWGSAWRMPTAEEIDELIESCNWEWVEDFNGSGVNGRLGTSKANGATIFLPAAGRRYNTDLNSAGRLGHYWSSSCNENYSFRAGHAFYLIFHVERINRDDEFVRDYGFSVRAVLR